MIKKEFAEIRKILNKKDCRVDRIAGCYVNGEKTKIITFNQSFLSVEEEASFKYCDLFKKTLSGKPGKNLVSLSFSGDEGQDTLLALRDSGLSDGELLNTFFNQIIETYAEPENYLILLAYGTYDVPFKGEDGRVLEDASEDVYQFILCSICRVPLTKPGLCYSDQKNSFMEKLRDREVSMPDVGFLFPAFNGRQPDVNEVVLYSKKSNNLPDELIELLGCNIAVPGDVQNEAFWSAVGNHVDYTYETAFKIDQRLKQKIAEADANDENAEEDPEDLAYTIRAYLPEESKEQFKEDMSEIVGNKALAIENLTDRKKIVIENDDLKLQISNNFELIETQVIDGHEYIMIPITNDLKLNGLSLKPKK